MVASLAGLHARYRLQATWTAPIRQRLLASLDADPPLGILEVGSGTGVITGEMSRRFAARTFGIDIEPEIAAFAARQDPASLFAAADGATLPFPKGTFDACVCHYLFLWVRDPDSILREMVRVTRKHGRVLALAEPDYRGRIDHPPELGQLGLLQAQALEDRGADPSIGRKLRGLFSAAGLFDVQAGVLGGEWHAVEPAEEAASEWEMILSDLASLDAEQVADYRRLEEEARRSGTRILYVPTFYAAGTVA